MSLPFYSMNQLDKSKKTLTATNFCLVRNLIKSARKHGMLLLCTCQIIGIWTEASRVSKDPKGDQQLPS